MALHVSLQHFLIVSAVLFSLGLFAVVTRRNAIMVLMGIELVKDRATKEPFDQAGRMVYVKAFQKGLAWIPAGHILRMSPPIVMNEAELTKGLELIDEAIGETEKELGCAGG